MTLIIVIAGGYVASLFLRALVAHWRVMAAEYDREHRLELEEYARRVRTPL